MYQHTKSNSLYVQTYLGINLILILILTDPVGISGDLNNR